MVATTANFSNLAAARPCACPRSSASRAKEVRIRRHGLGVLLEPVKFDAKAWFEAMDRRSG